MVQGVLIRRFVLSQTFLLCVSAQWNNATTSFWSEAAAPRTVKRPTWSSEGSSSPPSKVADTSELPIYPPSFLEVDALASIGSPSPEEAPNEEKGEMYLMHAPPTPNAYEWFVRAFAEAKGMANEAGRFSGMPCGNTWRLSTLNTVRLTAEKAKAKGELGSTTGAKFLLDPGYCQYGRMFSECKFPLAILSVRRGGGGIKANLP